MINNPRKSSTDSVRTPGRRPAKRFISAGAGRVKKRPRTQSVTYGVREEKDQNIPLEDEQLRKEIQEAIDKDDLVPSSSRDVEIKVAHGMVTLKGEVFSDEEKMNIGDKAVACAGFGKVINQLEVIGSAEE